MPRLIFELMRDPRGSLVHVRRRDDGACLGCIEVGLYEILRALIIDGVKSEKAIAGGDRQKGG